MTAAPMHIVVRDQSAAGIQYVHDSAGAAVKDVGVTGYRAVTMRGRRHCSGSPRGRPYGERHQA
jgi:hypothetical protein